MIWTRSLLIWSQTRYRCATESPVSAAAISIQKQNNQNVAHKAEISTSIKAWECWIWTRSLLIHDSSKCLATVIAVPQLGWLATSCNLATGKLSIEIGVNPGLLWQFKSCWLGVLTKVYINMLGFGEPDTRRLFKENRTGTGGKPSIQKIPCESVVGPHWWVVGLSQPGCSLVLMLLAFDFGVPMNCPLPEADLVYLLRQYIY